MTKEEKELLMKDLCARLPYEPWVWFKENWETNPNFIGCQSQLRLYHLEYIVKDMDITLKPYLRPMSSMTEEEKKEYELFANHCILTSIWFEHIESQILIDWLNAHYFDYRGLIEKGLALEAPENMYKEK